MNVMGLHSNGGLQATQGPACLLVSPSGAMLKRQGSNACAAAMATRVSAVMSPVAVRGGVGPYSFAQMTKNPEKRMGGA